MSQAQVSAQAVRLRVAVVAVSIPVVSVRQMGTPVTSRFVVRAVTATAAVISITFFMEIPFL